MNPATSSCAPQAPAIADATDGQLLSRFVEQRDEAAFAGLVERHGTLVYSVCRRVLQNDHDTQDAFQATFLVLVRKAGSIKPRGMVANWLYGVAHRAALKAKAMRIKRSAREKQVETMPEVKSREDIASDLSALLDQELIRLPDKYRVPIVLCDLEGKSQKEAARQLRWPLGTVSGRLARGRRMLAKRLARCGLAGAGSFVSSQHIASSCVPTALVSSTVKVASLVSAGHAASGLASANVIAVTEGVVKAMLLTKLKIATAALVGLAVVGGGMSAFHHKAQAANEPSKPKVQKDADAILGTWAVVDIKEAHFPPPTGEQWAILRQAKYIFTADTITIFIPGKQNYAAKYKLDPTTTPKRLIGTSPADPGIAIYSLEGDRLRYCTGGGKIPDSFNVENLPAGTQRTCWTLRREK